MKSTQANYFKIGLFVIVATMLIFIAIMVLGAGSLFRPKVYGETYLDEAVSGLNVGSDVRLRGVKIGSVEMINFSPVVYEGTPAEDLEKSYVVVRFVLYPETFGRTMETAGKNLKKEIETGLRARVKSQGITGALFIDIDYVDPEHSTPFQPPWQPEQGVFYIPSAPSFITSLTDSIQGILRKLEQLDIEGLFGELRETLNSLDSQIDNADVGKISDNIYTLIEELQKVNESIYGILEKPEIDTLIANTAETTEHLMEASENVQQATAQIETFLTSDEMNDIISNLAQVTDHTDTLVEKDIKGVLIQIKVTLKRLDLLVSQQQNTIAYILENLAKTSSNIEDITESAEQYPARIILGDPPPKMEMEK